jgi:hypothetical protein
MYIPLLFPLDSVEGRRQEPPGQQRAQSQFGRNGHFPLVEEPEVQEFDRLPKDQQIRVLADAVQNKCLGASGLICAFGALPC